MRIFTLDLWQDWVIEWIQELRQQLEIDGDDFEFVQRLAEGLVQVFQSRTDNTEEVRYLALIQDGVIKAKRWVVPGGLTRIANGDVVLAQVVVPALDGTERHAACAGWKKEVQQTYPVLKPTTSVGR